MITTYAHGRYAMLVDGEWHYLNIPENLLHPGAKASYPLDRRYLSVRVVCALY